MTPGFDFDQLRTFVAVADAGSLSAAAPRVFLSQSSVSEQVRKLEERVGVTLFTRGKQGVTPTPAGERLLGHARQLLAQSEQAWHDVRGFSLAGELRLAITDYFRPADVARMLRHLGVAYPSLRIHVTILKSGEIESGYDTGDFDIGLSMRVLGKALGREAVPGTRTLGREPLDWVASPERVLVAGAPLPLLVLPDTCALHRFTTQWLDDHRVPYTIAHVASGVAGLQLALAAGLGVACLNASAAGPSLARIETLMPGRRLPALPDAEFHLLPARRGEPEWVTQAREALAAQLTAR
ncbi:LysR family transcriptional regulator [Pandoraea terrigena]|uniref:HTH-type transcriptional activator AllS n=1 Tax=Pandoraea terrigena TaxID=2508292 RepID=A0A5E4SYW7_9BURK|nr:LysR family transcriptional regulator [Pandoraea terrigena]VVD79518.1 HTH-type transcriptional activator AllS [Pandoraea terrigena]